MPARWNYHSNVTLCGMCEGAGRVCSQRRATASDPYPEVPCDCGLGEHAPECPVCGFTQVVQGFDCLVCDTVAHLYPTELARLDADEFAHAMRVAIEAARKDERIAA